MRHIDLVDFGDLHLFMFRHDNLYERFVPADRKGRSISAVQERNLRSGFPPAPIDRDGARATDDPLHVFSILTDHLARTDGSVTVLDVGAHVGAFGIKIANFLRTAGIPGRVVCFEPGTASELLPHNVVLNGLTDRVDVELLAVSDRTGLDVLHITPGNSDSDSLIGAGLRGYEKIVSTIRVDDYVRQHAPTGGLIVKLDTEGLEPRLIASMKDLRASRSVVTVFEFMPWRYANDRFGLDLLESLGSECLLFDVHYAPRVSGVDFIDNSDLAMFVAQVRGRPFGYTDVLAIPRRLPGAGELRERFGQLRREEGVLTL